MKINLLKLLLLAFGIFGWAKEPFFRSKSKSTNESLIKIIEWSQGGSHQGYSKALSLSEKLRSSDSLTGGLMKSLVLLAEYDDLGKTGSLKQASQLLQKLQVQFEDRESTSEEFYFLQKMVALQYGFSEILLGNEVSGAMEVRSAANDLKSAKYAEGQGFYAMYAYNFSKATQWVPFVSDESEESRKSLKRNALGSVFFKPLFINALGWIYFDEKKFGKALTLLKPFLKNYPGNRVLHQMEADILRTKGDLYQAEVEYKKNREKYQAILSTGSVRDLSALGNLVLILKLSKKELEALALLDEFNSQVLGVYERMPASLKNEMEENGLQWSTP